MTTNNREKSVRNTYSNGLNSAPDINVFQTDAAANHAPFVKAITRDAEVKLENLILPTSPPAEDLTQEDDINGLIHHLELPVAPAMHYQLLTDDELCNLPSFQWRIKGVLPAHGLAVLFGQSGSGKSFLVLDMLQSLALGHAWFSHKVKPCSVTYCALEGEAGVANRIKAYQARYGATSVNIRYVKQSFNLLDADDISALAAAIKYEGTGDVVVLDTLSRATPGSDENDSKTMGQIISAAKILQDLIGGLVLLVHHTGKDTSRGMRGHSSLNAALDCAIEVKRKGEQREWIVAKSKDGEDGASHPFKLEVVLLGSDDDGDPVTSCVIVENQATQTIEKNMTARGSNQKTALKVLEDALSESSYFGVIDLQQEQPSLLFDQAIEMISPLMPGEAKHKKQRAKEALTGLIKNNLVATNRDRLWLN